MIRFEDQRLSRLPLRFIGLACPLHRLCGGRLFSDWIAQIEVAVHLAARAFQNSPGCDGAGAVVAGARLHSGLAARLWRVLISARSPSSSIGSCRWCSSSGPRIAYRYFRYSGRCGTPRRRSQSGAYSGTAADAEVLLRAIESGAVKKIWPAGILSSSRADQGKPFAALPFLAPRRSRTGVR